MLAKAWVDATALGFHYKLVEELEFFLMAEREGEARGALQHDRGGYFTLATDMAAEVRREIVASLSQMGVQVETSHHEVAAGQHELDFAPTEGLRAADAIVTARYVAKAVAQRRGLWATFMPKPFYGINGSGLHLHQQLISVADRPNAFSDAQDTRYGLTTVPKHFIAGQLTHAGGLCALLCPLVHSYKPPVPGFAAPVAINWGRVNREALIRVPRTANGVPGGTRVELRCADPSCNPYLALTVMLQAGLGGRGRGREGPPRRAQRAG